MRGFTLEELGRYDGQEDRVALIAYRGKVYDVSRSFLWQGGKHQVVHVAGTDLSDAITQAPHGPELITRFPVVGVITEKEHGATSLREKVEGGSLCPHNRPRPTSER